MEATPPVPSDPQARPDGSPEPVRGRDQFDALLRARIAYLVDAAEAAPTQERRRAVRLTAQQAEQRARRFADAVDSGGETHLAYDDAVVIIGPRSTQVCDLTSYDDAPFYWQALAGAGPSEGEVLAGVDLLAELRGQDAAP